MYIGKAIKQTRISKNLKQRAIAAAVGISVTAYSDIEREKTIHVSIQRIEQIAQALDVPLTEILDTHESNDALLKRIDELKQELDYMHERIQK